MQSIFPLSWCADRIAPKMQTGKGALDGMRNAPVVEIPVLNRLKRRRTGSPEPQLPLQGHSSKKQRSDDDNKPRAQSRLPTVPLHEASHPLPPASTPASAPVLLSALPQAPVVTQQLTGGHERQFEESKQPNIASKSQPDTVMEGTHPTTTASQTDLTPLQQVIENEFSMQILMKHNELRLIEQELAKCQVALEQLRRCELRPYPGAEHPEESVSAGTGPATAPPPGYTRPTHAAPHGVVDGPYSRHYRHWLLHDPQFDSISTQAQMAADSHHLAAARSTRLNGSARKLVSRPSAISGRGLDAQHSIPNYPAPAPKDKSAALVLRRSTDGQLVKLICNNCQRGNFSSIQGFLNHCRIAHKVDYKSHDAAAVDCGRLLDEHEAANLPPETQHAPPPKPAASRSSSVISTPLKNTVHPMNAAASVPIRTSIPPLSHARPVKSMAAVAVAAPYGRAPPIDSTTFKASAQAPRLSSHLAKHNFGVNLEQAIASAKQKIDLGVDEEVASPESLNSASPSVPFAGARTVTGSGRAGALGSSDAFGRPPSRKGYREPAQRHRPAPLAPAPFRVSSGLKQEHGEIPESPQDLSATVSPHTADSNPGLVSDHEDDDHGSASEDEVPQAAIAHSLGVSRNACTDNMDIDVAVEDDVDRHGVVIRRNSMLAAADNRGIRATGSPARKLGTGHQGP